MGRRRRGRGRNEFPGIAVAFGIGILLAMFFSAKLALIAAAIALIYIGIRCKPC